MQIREEYVVCLLIAVSVMVATLLLELCAILALTHRIKRLNRDILQIKSTVKGYIEAVCEERDKQSRKEKEDWQSQIISSVLQEYLV